MRNVMSFAATALIAIAGSCDPKISSPTTTGKGSSAAPMYQAKDLPLGLDLRLSDGQQGKPAVDRSKLAPASKLSDADVAQLLSRATPIKSESTDQTSFALRPASQPPPRTGETIKASFPAPQQPPTPPPGASDAGRELRVLRYMPEGAVKIAPQLSVTFSQPMVAVTSQDDAAAVKPVKLVPEPKGSWRWIGTRTIVFAPDVRFPQSTTYKVEIPAGTKSPQGGVLKSAVAFSFETPPPLIISHYPDGGQPQRLDVPMMVEFDQKIDAQRVLGLMKVSANGEVVAVRMVDAAEVAGDKQLAAAIDQAKQAGHEGRYVVFRAVKPLPADASISIEIPQGTPSAEGPNKTTSSQSFQFRTYSPLRVVAHECGYGDVCRPGMALQVEFNNPLDEDKFDPQWVTVTPPIPGMHVIAAGNTVSLVGMTKARTSYKVAVSGRIVDEFGQSLGKDHQHSYSVGDALPYFFGPSGMVVLDPAATKPTLDFFTTNYDQLKVKLFQVDPTVDLAAYGRYVNEQWNHDHPPPAPGKKVVDRTIKTAAGNNELVETSIDLTPALRNGLGHVVAVVEPYPWKERYEPPRMIAWVQSTKIGISAHVDNDNLIALATDLATGKRLADVSLEMLPFGIKATTDSSGAATMPLESKAMKGPTLLVARRGGDVGFVSGRDGYYDADYDQWVKRPRSKQLVWYVVDDRKMYKPDEEVRLKGFLRTNDPNKGGDIGALAGIVTSLSYRVTDASGNEIAKGSAPVSAAGGFDAKFKLPKTPNLGYATVAFTTAGSMVAHHNHSFQIQEFRRPEYEVSTQPSVGPFLVGGGGDVTVDAKYYSGGPLAGAQVDWWVTASQTTFTPPNRDEFVFGEWRPWWGYHHWIDDEAPRFGRRGGARRHEQSSWNFRSKTDAAGRHVLHLDALSVNPALPMSVTANATVMDVNRQAWTSSSSMIVHPAQYYVGLKAKKPFVEKGQPFDIDVIGVNIDGASIDADIEATAVRLDWEYKNGRYATKEVDPQTCRVKARATDKSPALCHFETKQGGTYQIIAKVVDLRGRPNVTKMTFWVTGGDNTPPAREVKQEVVQLIPNKKEYAAGTTAELLIQAPFFPAEGVVTWRRSGIVKLEHISLTGPTKIIAVPIDEAMTPNLWVQVDLVGAAARTDDKGDPDPKLPKRPAYAVGTISLPVPPVQRTLAVKVSPNAPNVGPGEPARLAVAVADARGQPVADAEVAIIAVDEAILALSGYQFSDPVGTFYGHRSPDTSDHYSRSYVKLAKPDLDKLAETRSQSNFASGRAAGGAPLPASAPVASMEQEMDGGGRPEAPAKPKRERAMADERESKKDAARMLGKVAQASSEPANKPIAIRSNFNPLAAFAPAVKTGTDGKAVVDIKLPDNLTRYRIVAIAAAGAKQFGKGESAITARLPLMVRPSPPRFLNFGDTFRLPVVVQNQTDAPMTVKLAMRTANATLTDGAGRQVSVPPNERVEVQFPAAAEMAGTARFQIIGASGSASDAAELSLPVWTPATTEAFATYGVIDQGAMKQKVALPGKVVTQFGGLEVTTASTNLQALTDAMLYLVHYPFECAEQRSSRILAIAALRDVLTAFKVKDLPSAKAMERSVDADIERLSQMQNGDGGFAFWDRGFPSEPYLTVFVSSALTHARAKGFTVPQAIVDRAKSYLQNIESYYPWYYPPQVRWAISAYALYTRKQMGDLDIAKGQALLRNAGGVEKVTAETNGWLLGVFAGQPNAASERSAIMRYALNHLSETAGAANFTTSYGDGNYLLLASDRRVDGVMLESLIQEQKNSDVIPKLVTGLLAHRKAGRWINTQENAFALLALDRYFRTYENVTPDFVARVWLGNDYAGEHAFKGRTTEYHQIGIAMKDVASHDGADLTIQKDGAGRLYYRIGMTYAPASLALAAADYGFVVERKYQGVDDPKDVSRGSDGTWRIKAGTRVRVTLTMVNDNRRYHVALVDPMPAGLEAMNPALAVTGPIPMDPNEQKSRGAYWWWSGTWYEHQNMRDERVEAFASLLWEGVHQYTYVARATTPGNFVVPPPKAEEMYMPETFGRGASDRVVIE
jgi:uncharacterized protein YfaS (alpha-2-macroglobulin family)